MQRIKIMFAVTVAVAMVISVAVPAWANGSIPPDWVPYACNGDGGTSGTLVTMCKIDTQQEICVNYHAVEQLALHGFALAYPGTCGALAGTDFLRDTSDAIEPRNGVDPGMFTNCLCGDRSVWMCNPHTGQEICVDFHAAYNMPAVSFTVGYCGINCFGDQ